MSKCQLHQYVLDNHCESHEPTRFVDRNKANWRTKYAWTKPFSEQLKNELLSIPEVIKVGYANGMTAEGMHVYVPGATIYTTVVPSQIKLPKHLKLTK